MGMACAFAVWGWARTLSLACVPGTPLCSPVGRMGATPRRYVGGLLMAMDCLGSTSTRGRGDGAAFSLMVAVVRHALPRDLDYVWPWWRCDAALMSFADPGGTFCSVSLSSCGPCMLCARTTTGRYLLRVGGRLGEGPCVASGAWDTRVPCCCFRVGASRVMLPPSAGAFAHVFTRAGSFIGRLARRWSRDMQLLVDDDDLNMISLSWMRNCLREEDKIGLTIGAN